MNDDNVKGAATAFCVFTPFKTRGARLWHWCVTKAAPVATEDIRLLRFLHYMSFVSVGSKHLKCARLPHRGRWGRGGMLFVSAYNGRAQLYFRGFSQKLAPQMHQLWRGCVDWKGADVYDDLEQFIADYRLPSNFHFNAYPDTSFNLRAALRLRAELDELVALAHRDSAARFLNAYRHAAQVVWGRPLDREMAT